MSKVKVPTDPDGLLNAIGDPTKAAKIFSDRETTKEFLDSYAKAWVQTNPDANAYVREQVQAVTAELLRENGLGNNSAINLANQIQFVNGKPVMNLPADSVAAISKGRGAVYNSNTVGARMEQAIPAQERFHSIGEYCQAIRYKMTNLNGPRRDEMINKLDRVTSFMNSFSSEDPGAGGFLIPEIMRSELYALALEDSIVRSRATVIPMSTLSVPIPAVDDTSHVSSVFGGITFAWTEEASSIAESAATFDRITLTAKKLAGTFIVPNELLNDAPAFGAFISQRLPKALAWFEDNAFMNGTGSGQPLGFINAPANVAVAAESGQAAATIVWENVVKMYQSMLPTSVGNAVWIVSHDTFAELATMALSVGTGGGPVWLGHYANPGSNEPPMNILGRPVYKSEKAPKLGSVGDISLVDLSYYLVGDRQAMEVAASEHYKFQNDQTTFRLIERVDGRPWIQSALTPHNNSTVKLSPFVQLAAR